MGPHQGPILQGDLAATIPTSKLHVLLPKVLHLRLLLLLEREAEFVRGWYVRQSHRPRDRRTKLEGIGHGRDH